MAVDVHPSRRPSEPRVPPATSTTSGTINKGGHSDSGQEGVEYGFRHELQVKPPHVSEMAHHFHDAFTGGKHGGKKPGKEEPQEGPHKGEHAGKPGDEKGNDEPG